MLIDWFTVFAQTVNFLILVWLLRRFLYTPVLNAIDAREKRIAAELADAAAQKEEARIEQEGLKWKSEEFERQRGVLMAQAAHDAEAAGRRLLEDARKESENLLARRRDAFSRDFASLKEEIRGRTCEEVLAIARKTLEDLASAALEEQMVNAFVRRCRAEGGQEKEGLALDGGGADAPVLVRSAFTLSSELQERLEGVIRDVLRCSGPIRFEKSTEPLCGIAVIAGGRQVAWSIAEYMAGFEKNIGDLLTAGV